MGVVERMSVRVEEKGIEILAMFFSVAQSEWIYNLYFFYNLCYYVKKNTADKLENEILYS